MQQRKDIDWGRDQPPEQAWDAYRRNMHGLLLALLTPARMRFDHAPGEEAKPDR